MKFQKLSIVCFTLFCYANLFAQPHLKSFATTSGTLHPFGLKGEKITALTTETQEHPIPPHFARLIFAGTNEDGVFQVSPFVSAHDWISLGLAGKSVTALTVQRWGVGPIDGLRLFAAVRPNFQLTDSTLIYRREIFVPIDTVWTAADSGVNHAKLTKINGLNSYYFTGHRPPQPLILGGENGIYYSTFSNIWNEANVDTHSQLLIHSIDVNPHWFGDLAWAVGCVDFFASAFRSNDQGVSWKTYLLPLVNQAEAFAIVINPRNPDSLYVGYRGGVLLTPDSGQSWKMINLSNQSVTFRALAVDPFAPENVFAGGIGDNHSFAFYHSTNSGATWTRVQPDMGEEIAGVTSLVVVKSDDPGNQTFVFIGTDGTGVWLYKPIMVTRINQQDQIPEEFVLHQNYPNPFNPETTISYEIAISGHIVITIYNLLGQPIRTLVNAWQTTGVYRLKWDGKEAKRDQRSASGVYIYELKTADTVIRKKMVLLQ
ncbi:MAG: T9SS type A sorting domain-containing protein [bacterium]